MSDLPLDGRKPAEVKEPKPDLDAKHTHKETMKPLSQEELKAIQEQQQKKGFQLQIIPSKQGNELEIICRLISALNGNVAALTIAVQNSMKLMNGEKGVGPKQ